jgi:pyruvate dehydrogenase E1 component beta subunit
VRFDEALRLALYQEMQRDAAVVAFGEGINDPGGFFGTTVGLAAAFGPDRCFDVPNSEEALTGLAVGAALGGLRPVLVHLRTEFLLLSMNQLVNHAAKWGPMHGRAVHMPMTVRAMVGRGWGQGAQHSGSYAAMLAHVPGLTVAVPSGPARGAGLLVSAVRGTTPTILVEPKAVFESMEELPEEIAPVPLGQAFVDRAGGDFTLIGLGDTVALGHAVADALHGDGISVEVVDLCSLAPFDGDTVLASVRKTGRCGVVDIGWADYGVAAQVAKALASAPDLPLRFPLLSWAPGGHAPAGCFAEAGHYPTVDTVAQDVRRAVARRPA